MDGERRTGSVEPAPAVTSEQRQGLLQPPGALDSEEQACWQEWAALAIERHALTPGTEAGFRELCARMAMVRRLDAKIMALGGATNEALLYLKERRGWAKDLNTSLKDFRLTGFGKPEAGEKPKKAANPFAQLG
jgi:hypothetical protein